MAGRGDGKEKVGGWQGDGGEPSDRQCRRRLGLAASPAASGRDWGLKSRPKAGTGPGLGTGVPTEGWDWDWHERAKAETDSDWGLKSTQ